MTEELNPPSLRYRILPALQRIGIDTAKLKKAKVLIIGAGGIGSRLAIFLARYPINEIRIIDNGYVDAENIGYQFYPANMLGNPKAEAISKLVKMYFPWANIKGIIGEVPDIGWIVICERIGVKYDTEGRLNRLLNLMKDSNLIIVSTDTLGSRVAAWLAAMYLNKPFIDVGFRESYGHIYVWFPGYMCPLDFQLIDSKQFIRSEPGYPVEPFTADLIALVTSKIIMSVINGEITESVMIFINATYNNILSELSDTIQVYQWPKGVCEHYKIAQESIFGALIKLAREESK